MQASAQHIPNVLEDRIQTKIAKMLRKLLWLIIAVALVAILTQILFGIDVAGAFGFISSQGKAIEKVNEQTATMTSNTEQKAHETTQGTMEEKDHKKINELPDSSTQSPKLLQAYELQKEAIVDIQANLYAKALQQLEKVISIYKRVKGKNYTKIADILVKKIADIYFKQGKYTQALKSYSEGLSIYARTQGKESYNVAGTLHQIAWIYYLKGDYSTSMDYNQMSLQMWKKVTAPDSREAANTINNIGLIHKSLKQNQQALKCFNQTIFIYQRLGMRMSVEVADALNNMGLVYHHLRKYNWVQRYFLQALEIYTVVKGGGCIEAATTLTNMGVHYKDLAKYRQAFDMFQRSIDIYIRNDLKHREYANNHFWLGHVFELTSEHDKATDSYRIALPIYEELILGGELKATVIRLSSCLTKLRREDQKRQLQIRYKNLL